MTVRIEKPAINVREELADLRKPSGVAGEAMLRADTPQEQFNLIGAGRRNLIINGAMQVAQRGTSANITGYGYHTVDRWHTIANSGMNYNVTMSQEPIADAPFGFSHSLKLLTTSAQTTVFSENYSLRYSIEGSDVRHLKYGTSNAEYITLSFWVKSNKTGTYSLQPYALNTAGNTSYLTSYTINNPDTWEYKSIVIQPNTKRSINYTDTAGLFIDFNLDSGPDDIVDPYNWAAAGAARAVEGQVGLLDTVNNYWQITGVQLELGKVATPFEHRSYGEELALCQRYYEVLGQEYNAFYTGYLPVMQPDVTGQAARSASLPHQVTKRAVPTVGDIDMQYYTGSWVSVSNVLADGVNYTRVTGASSSGHSLLRGRIYADAEL